MRQGGCCLVHCKNDRFDFIRTTNETETSTLHRTGSCRPHPCGLGEMATAEFGVESRCIRHWLGSGTETLERGEGRLAWWQTVTESDHIRDAQANMSDRWRCEMRQRNYTKVMATVLMRSLLNMMALSLTFSLLIQASSSLISKYSSFPPPPPVPASAYITSSQFLI